MFSLLLPPSLLTFSPLLYFPSLSSSIFLCKYNSATLFTSPHGARRFWMPDYYMAKYLLENWIMPFQRVKKKEREKEKIRDEVMKRWPKNWYIYVCIWVILKIQGTFVSKEYVIKTIGRLFRKLRKSPRKNCVFLLVSINVPYNIFNISQ